MDAIRSPFPGMDPYLERYWENAHARLIGYIADAVAEQLPDDLSARAQERVYIDDGDDAVSRRHPDVRVVAHPAEWRQTSATPDTLAVAERVVLRLEVDPITERFIEILDMDGSRIVTAIEVLSPTNKRPGAGREAYLKKRREFLDSDANLVEIDLVRSGDGLTLLMPHHVPRPYRTTYRVSVRRAATPHELELYPITLRQSLPSIGVPLRQGEGDVTLDLQSLLERVYRYSRMDRIDYRRPSEPPLDDEDAAWADGLLKAAGKR